MNNKFEWLTLDSLSKERVIFNTKDAPKTLLWLQNIMRAQTMFIDAEHSVAKDPAVVIIDSSVLEE